MRGKRIVKFRVYPESIHGSYLDVEIHPTVEAMRHAAKRAERKSKGRVADFQDAEAVTCGFGKGYVNESGRTIWRKTLGTMFFHKDRLGMEVITHEAAHAAIRWAERKDITLAPDPKAGPASDDEERFCYAVGRIAAQIAGKGHDLGLYE